MVMAHQKQRHLQGHVKDILPANQLGKKFYREIKVFNTAETSLSVKYNVGIHSVVHRQTAAEMGSFPRPGTGADTHDTHRDSEKPSFMQLHHPKITALVQLSCQ